MENEIVIRLETIGKSYDHKMILQNINLDIYRNEIFGLLGPSGSGKTTLVKIIVGIERANPGICTMLNTQMPNIDMFHRIGYMAQSDALYMDCTALENLKFFAALNGVRGKKAQSRIVEVMELLNLQEDLHKKVSQYSGGMKRRLSLAISLLHQPEILILDEPTVGIDPLLRQSIWQEFRRLQASGITILITTHVMDEAEKCSRLGMIREGQLIAIGSPEELRDKHHVNSLEEAFLAYGGGVKS